MDRQVEDGMPVRGEEASNESFRIIKLCSSS